MSDIPTLPKVFTGGHLFGELATRVITSTIMNGGRPVRPQEVQGLGLTDSVWDMTVRCCRTGEGHSALHNVRSVMMLGGAMSPDGEIDEERSAAP